MAKGGKRPGAGRKKGITTLEREKARAYIAEKINEYMPAIFKALVEKASEGDVPAIKELFDRAFGKSIQAVELSGKDGEPLFKPTEEEIVRIDQSLDNVIERK